MGAFLGWAKKLFRTITDSDVEDACNELKRRLKEKGYNPDYPPDHGGEYQSGMRVWVVLSDPANESKEKTVEDLRNQIAEIKAINIEIAKQFGLNPTGKGPVQGERGIFFAFCGFHTFHFLD